MHVRVKFIVMYNANFEYSFKSCRSDNLYKFGPAENFIFGKRGEK